MKPKPPLVKALAGLNAARVDYVMIGVLAVNHYEWTCHAFCLMTNHYHLVLDTTRENLSDGMQLLNGDYAQGLPDLIDVDTAAGLF